MGLELLIERGIKALRVERSGELRELLGDEKRAHDAEEALAILPTALTALDELAWDDDATTSERAIISVVMGFGLKAGSLIPAEDGKILLSVLDDAYIALYAAERAEAHLRGIDIGELRRHRANLRSALPIAVITELENMVDETLQGIAEASNGRK